MATRPLMTFKAGSINTTAGVPSGDVGYVEGKLWAREGFLVGDFGLPLDPDHFVTLDGIQTVSGKTIVDPVLNLVSSTGAAKEVVVGRGSGLSPIWGTLASALVALAANGVVFANSAGQLTSSSALQFAVGNQDFSVGGAATQLGSSYTSIQVVGGTNAIAGGFRARSLNGSIDGFFYGDSSGFNFGSVTNHPIKFLVNNAEISRFTSTGLGIGTSSPEAPLHSKSLGIQGVFEYDSTNKLFVFHSGSVGYVGTLTNQPLVLRTNNVDRVTVDTAGNFGLGVTPRAWGAFTKAIEVGEGSAIWNPGSSFFTLLMTNSWNDGSVYRYKSTGGATRYQQSGDTHSWWIAPVGTAGTEATFTQDMTLNATGLGIGTTDTSNGKLTVVAGTSATGNSAFFSNLDGTYNPYLQIRHSSVGITLFASSSFGGAANNIILENNDGKLTFSGAGNLGLGVTPDFDSEFTVFETTALYMGHAAGALSNFELGVNTKRVGGQYLYRNSSFATIYQQENGNHRWFTAPSGTAGTGVTFTQVMTLNTSGQLLVGLTSGSQRLEVSGNIRARGISTSAFLQAETDSVGSFTGLQLYNPTNTVEFMNRGDISTVLLTSTAFPLSIVAPTFVALTGGGLSAILRNTGIDIGGTSPSGSWASDYRVVQLGSAGFVGGLAQWTGNCQTHLTSNLYNDGVGWKYGNAGFAAMFTVLGVGGEFIWYTAPSGSQGAAATLTSVMTLKNDGRLVVGGTTAYARIMGVSTGGEYSLGLGGTSKGIRFAHDADRSAIEGVDNTLSASYQPLRIGGSQVSIGILGTDIAIWDGSGNIIQKLNGTAPSLSTNSTMTFELTDNTTLTIKVRGSDGTTRSGTVTLT